jgi:hypothetical protein
MAPLLPGEEGSSGVRARDNRQFMETVRGTTVRMSSLRELCALVSYSTVAAI